ncbi:MAG: PucR family transcriptional regulator, partial [Peptostreptococcaceae bacterium]
QKEIQKNFRYEIHIGSSEIIHNYLSVKEVYQKVKESILIGTRERINKPIIFIEDYKFEHLLLQLSTNEMFQDFVIDKLNLLEEYDIMHQSEFLDTLKALIKCRGSRTEAALNLYLHRNTLAYRIKKIEQITGYSLSDYENLFQLELALRIKDYM